MQHLKMLKVLLKRQLFQMMVVVKPIKNCTRTLLLNQKGLLLREVICSTLKQLVKQLQLHFIYCETFDISTISADDIRILISAFKSKLSDKKLRETRKIYGILLCINSKQSSKRSAYTELHAFFDSLDGGDVLEELIFSYGEEEEEDATYSLAFVVDDTGSMGDEIGAVKSLILINGFIRTENVEPIIYILSTFNDLVSNSYISTIHQNNLQQILSFAKLINDMSKPGETIMKEKVTVNKMT